MDERELYFRLIGLLDAGEQSRVRAYIAENDGATYAEAIDFMRTEFPLTINDERAAFETSTPGSQVGEPAEDSGAGAGFVPGGGQRAPQDVDSRFTPGSGTAANPYLVGAVTDAFAQQDQILDLQIASAQREFDLFTERANANIVDLNTTNELSETSRRIAEHSQRRATLGSYATAGLGDSGVSQRARQQAATAFGLTEESASQSYSQALRGIDEAMDDAEFDFNFVTQLLASQNSSLIGGLL